MGFWKKFSNFWKKTGKGSAKVLDVTDQVLDKYGNYIPIPAPIKVAIDEGDKLVDKLKEKE